MQEAQGPLGEWENPSLLPIHRHPSSQSLESISLRFSSRLGCGMAVLWRIQEPQLPTWPLWPRDAGAETGLGVGCRSLVVKRRQPREPWSPRRLGVGECPAAPPPTGQAQRGGLGSATEENQSPEGIRTPWPNGTEQARCSAQGLGDAIVRRERGL